MEIEVLVPRVDPSIVLEDVIPTHQLDQITIEGLDLVVMVNQTGKIIVPIGELENYLLNYSIPELFS